jgi:hypothetical protein
MILYSVNNFNTTKECTDTDDDIQNKLSKQVPKVSHYHAGQLSSRRADLTEKPDQMDPTSRYFSEKFPEVNKYKFKELSTPRKPNKLEFLQRPNQSTEKKLLANKSVSRVINLDSPKPEDDIKSSRFEEMLDSKY